MPYPYPVVPETITVHLGAPGESARNVVVPFAQYIKNVASHEIYPTWPESAIRANILAQISYALNRVYTEYYRMTVLTNGVFWPLGCPAGGKYHSKPRFTRARAGSSVCFYAPTRPWARGACRSHSCRSCQARLR